jgi:hypothetical protein
MTAGITYIREDHFNGAGSSFNAHLRDELLEGEVFYTLKKAKVVIESWRRHYNAVRPHPRTATEPSLPRYSCLRSLRGPT